MEYADYVTHDTSDAAVIRLKNAVQFTDYIQPISLRAGQQAGLPQVDLRSFISGFGVVNVTSLDQAQVLEHLPLNVASPVTCRQVDRLRIKEDEFCAGLPTGDYMNVCYGDSGGPIVSQLPGGRWTQIGVVKRGVRNCPDNFKYAVYTNLTTIYDWIEENTRNVFVNEADGTCVLNSPTAGFSTGSSNQGPPNFGFSVSQPNRPTLNTQSRPPLDIPDSLQKYVRVNTGR